MSQERFNPDITNPDIRIEPPAAVGERVAGNPLEALLVPGDEDTEKIQALSLLLGKHTITYGGADYDFIEFEGSGPDLMMKLRDRQTGLVVPISREHFDSFTVKG